MRTYGEGFVIADQSPKAMDETVIRNTGTKVIFRLPQEEDRRCVGRAMALREEQILEIARLKTGIAVIHQGHWESAVLCRTDYFDPSVYRPFIWQRKTKEELEEKFGSRVAFLVESESEDKSRSWMERKGTTVEHLKSATRDAKNTGARG